MNFIIVSGLSGAGKSVALHTLEDIGYNCIDNLPLFLLTELALGLKDDSDQGVGGYLGTAVGIDARNRPQQLCAVPAVLTALSQQQISPQILFLEAETDVLMTRFNETRRKHPLTSGERSLTEAIDEERRLLAPLRAVAQARIDTTYTNIHELRERVRTCLHQQQTVGISILLQSFGYKKGAPEGFDFVFDVRCLPNPHWQPELRALTGRDQAVVAYLEQHPTVLAMRDDLINFFERWTPAFEREGRSYLTIAIGCTGGQHRSVYLVETLRQHFADHGWQVLVRHREQCA